MKDASALPLETSLRSGMTHSSVSGIVLLAKKPGITSFSSLNIIKKSLGTKKVGHTGTLDSFAQGLLVVCTGSLTRLAGQITAFDKTYEAVIEFGVQTDTLDPTGVVIKNAPLPTLNALQKSLKKFTGKLKQRPPEFSAIKIGGKRASDLQREGKDAEIPEREITVYSSELNEVQFENDKVKYVRVTFGVSKGTYIRSLARDIGTDCGSVAHLVGLLRTKVGMFKLQDAAFANELEPFTIAGVTGGVLPSGVPEVRRVQGDGSASFVFANSKGIESPQRLEGGAGVAENVRQEIIAKMQEMSFELVHACGLEPLVLAEQYENDFYNGRPLKQKMFVAAAMSEGVSQLEGIQGGDSAGNGVGETLQKYAVFLNTGGFCGVISGQGGGFKYEFVVPVC